MATVTTPIATDATLSSGLTAIKNAIADTRGTTSMQCDNSDSWSSSTTYAVGKTVIYDNKVWECLVQNNGQTPSGTSTYWKQVTLSSLNSSLIWQLLNSVTGGTNVNLPNKFNEIIIIINANDNGKQCFIFNIPYAFLTSDTRKMCGGYAYNNTNTFVQVNVSLSSVKLDGIVLGGTSYLTTANTKVYYR